MPTPSTSTGLDTNHLIFAKWLYRTKRISDWTGRPTSTHHDSHDMLATGGADDR